MDHVQLVLLVQAITMAKHPTIQHITTTVIFPVLVNCTSTGQSKGIELTSGNLVLIEISKYFNQESVHDLAVILLDKYPGGGLGFIRQYTAVFGQQNWALMAVKVLFDWCDQSEERVFGGDLLKVLEEVCPPAAGKFKDKLLGTGNGKNLLVFDFLTPV